MPRGYLAKLVALVLVLVLVVARVGVVLVPDAKAEREARALEPTKTVVVVMVIAINMAHADMTVGWRVATEDTSIGSSGTYLGAKSLGPSA